jgi:hypothetical protein
VKLNSDRLGDQSYMGKSCGCQVQSGEVYALEQVVPQITPRKEKKRKDKTTPFGVNSMRSPELY